MRNYELPPVVAIKLNCQFLPFKQLNNVFYNDKILFFLTKNAKQILASYCIVIQFHLLLCSVINFIYSKKFKSRCSRGMFSISWQNEYDFDGRIQICEAMSPKINAISILLLNSYFSDVFYLFLSYNVNNFCRYWSNENLHIFTFIF